MKVGLPCVQANAFTFPMFQLLFWPSPLHFKAPTLWQLSDASASRNKWKPFSSPREEKIADSAWLRSRDTLGPSFACLGLGSLDLTVLLAKDSSCWEALNELKRMRKLSVPHLADSNFGDGSNFGRSHKMVCRY